MTEKAWCFALSFLPWWNKVQHSSRFLIVHFGLDLKELSLRSDTSIRDTIVLCYMCVYILCNDFRDPEAFTMGQEDSVHFSRSVMSNSLRPHELQHTRLPCPSPTPGVYPNSWPLSRWCHPTISSSVIPFSSCPQSFPASGSFQMSQFLASGGQRIGVSAQHQSFQWTPRTDLL